MVKRSRRWQERQAAKEAVQLASEIVAEAASSAASGREVPIEQLDSSIDALLAAYTGQVVSASRVVNPLLALWKRVSEVNRAAARPIEALLTVLARRELLRTAELAQTMRDVRETLHAEATASAS